MLFTLEALRARHGDSLLLHYGDPGAPRLILIDGGPSGVFRRFLEPRLEALRAERAGDGPLRLELMIVSHIDDDHIRGLLDLTALLRRLDDDGRSLPYDIRGLWHNSFDDVIGERVERLATAARDLMVTASTADDLPADVARAHPATIILSSVRQGRQLRLDAERLGLRINRGDAGPFEATGGLDDVPFDRDQLRLRVVGPMASEIEALHAEWDEELEKLGVAQPSAVEVAAYLDRSVFNLASLVLMAELDGKRMLLTGDARGDTVLRGLEQAGDLAPGGSMHVDILKIPHHGSDRNVDHDFFERILADHYVVSGDGRHGNPEPKALEMLLQARQDEPFHLHLTYAPEEMTGHPIPGLEALLDEARTRGVGVHTPGAADSLTIDLLDRLD